MKEASILQSNVETVFAEGEVEGDIHGPIRQSALRQCGLQCGDVGYHRCEERDLLKRHLLLKIYVRAKRVYDCSEFSCQCTSIHGWR